MDPGYCNELQLIIRSLGCLSVVWSGLRLREHTHGELRDGSYTVIVTLNTRQTRQG
jgi:hypothetical protein